MSDSSTDKHIRVTITMKSEAAIEPSLDLGFFLNVTSHGAPDFGTDAEQALIAKHTLAYAGPWYVRETIDGWYRAAEELYVGKRQDDDAIQAKSSGE
ncbi:uncharacterized protein F4812DRAFT_460707 [Daldinia caldariorum]|uniref:uncharacterized protein n=1 Tax=Daldinia caldariorum TaxID=326644 RepID=UPI002007EA4F|nr:uncharacterized protein F4812DRAFT_460707 [Daldinia caldariorum]KAI1466435.1 hypothetical protein F4812DRAFT_460707 [Daldinia caldariorum]